MSSARSNTARARLVAALTEEILQNPSETPFAIASEHQLCRRFNISRVTVRLSLSDLENRGLIYRKHGKGTFAYGRNTRTHRNVALLMPRPLAQEWSPISGFVRGLQDSLLQLGTGLLVTAKMPSTWRAEKAACLAGAVVIPQEGVTAEEIGFLQTRNLPYLIHGESELPGTRIKLAHQEAARLVVEKLTAQGHRRVALLQRHDCEISSLKRIGALEALTAAQIEPSQVLEFSARGNREEFHHKLREIFLAQPRITAVVAFDDFLAHALHDAAEKAGRHVPNDLSVVSLDHVPFFHYLNPIISGVRFNYEQLGADVTKALTDAAVTGQSPVQPALTYTLETGSTVAAAPAS